MLDRKDELERLEPALVPQRGHGPWVERPVATTGGVGDHNLTSIDEATENGRWIVQQVVDAPRARWRALIASVEPLEALVDPAAPAEDRAIIAAIIDVGRATLGEAPIGIDVELAGGLLMEITVHEGVPDATGLAPLVVPPLTGPLPVLGGIATWDLDDAIAVHGEHAGDLLVLDAVAAYVWAANADNLSVTEIEAESAGQVGALAAERLLVDWRHRGLVGAERPAGPTTSRRRTSSWNLAGHYRVLGRTVAVAVPSPAVLEWVDALLEPARVDATDDVDATVRIEREREGWRIDGRFVPSEHQVAALARDAVMTSARDVDDRASIDASALAGRDGAIVVLGGPSARRHLLVAWQRIGGRALADGVVRLDESGSLAEPSRIGLVHRHPYQWIDGEPAPAGAPDAPIVSRTGELVAQWTAPLSACASSELPIRMVVLPGDPQSDLVGASRREALVALVEARVAGASRIERAEAVALVALARVVPAARGPLDAPSALACALRDAVLTP